MTCFPGGLAKKNPTANVGDARDLGSIPGSGRSPGGGNGNPFQYSCLKNSTERGSWSKVNYFPMIHLPESEKRRGFYVMIIKLKRWCEIFLCHHVAGMLLSRGAGDPGSIPGLGRSPGKGNGNPLQCSCLENSMDRGAWWATVHGIMTERLILSLFRCIDNGEIFLTGPGLALIKSSLVNVDVNMDFVSISQHQRETFYDPMDFSTPGFPVLHHLLKFAQIHVY